MFASRRRFLLLPFVLVGYSSLALGWTRGGPSNPTAASAIRLQEDDTAGADLEPAVPQIEYLETDGSPSPRRALVFMDCFSPYHGLYMKQACLEEYGVAAISVLSDYMVGYLMTTQTAPVDDDDFDPRCMALPKDWEAWKNHLDKDIEIMSIYCESDAGLAAAEVAASCLNVTFPLGMQEARRNKYLMNQVLQEAGMKTAQQRLCTSIDEALEFFTTAMQSRACVVKPIRGCASDQVFLCKTEADIRNAFDAIFGSPVYAARRKHSNVLVQEYLNGQEYALDIVSREGEHKVAAVWKYDKRPANGAAFCYFSTILYDEPSNLESMVQYAKDALDALQVRNGITHTELIETKPGEFRLVEVNCRQHNMDFAPLTMICTGYNAFDMLLAAYLSESRWNEIPDMPTLRAFGRMVHLVNYVEGNLKQVNTNALQEIHDMESVLDLEVYPNFLEEGEVISKTIDIRSDAGWVQMVHSDPDKMERDYKRIVELMPTLFEVE